MILHFMIPRHDLRITRRRRAPVPASARSGLGRPLLLRLMVLLLPLPLCMALRRRPRPGGAVVHVIVLLLLMRFGRRLLLLVMLGMELGLGLALVALAAAAMAAVVDKDVDAAVLGVLGEGLVVVVVGRLGVLGDDVPGVEEAWDLWRARVLVGLDWGRKEETYVAQDEEEDVDDRVGGADAAFYPDCLREVVMLACRCHCQAADCCCGVSQRGDKPGSGGKRTAKRPRKISVEHMAGVSSNNLRKWRRNSCSLMRRSFVDRDSRLMVFQRFQRAWSGDATAGSSAVTLVTGLGRLA